jgi:hypothetical protein
LVNGPVTSLPVNADLTILAVANGTNLTLSINGVSVAAASDTAFPSGRIGLGTNAATVRFDDVTVTSR